MTDQNTRWYRRPAWHGFALTCTGVVLADAVFNDAPADRLTWHGILVLSLVGAVVAARRETAESKSFAALNSQASTSVRQCLSLNYNGLVPFLTRRNRRHSSTRPVRVSRPVGSLFLRNR